MANRKFYIEFYTNGDLQRLRIRNWADSNRTIFPEYGFTNRKADFPITHLIAHRLEHHYRFERIEINLDVILRNSNPSFSF